MGLLYTLSGTLSENQDFIKVSEYHCDDFIVMTVLWFFELGRGVWNAFRGHTQRGLNHAQPTKQIYTANWFYLYCSQFRSKNKQKPWQTQILQKRHRFSTKDPKVPRACRRYPRTQRPLRLIVTNATKPENPHRRFYLPRFYN